MSAPASTKEAKARWKRGTKGVLTRDAKAAFREGEYWTTTKGGYPAVVSQNKKYAIAFQRDLCTGTVSAVSATGGW
jgi:hypothetical protein